MHKLFRGQGDLVESTAGRQAGDKESRHVDDLALEAFKEHPKLLIILAIGFLFGFGFVFAAIYLIFFWLRSRSRRKKIS